MKILGLEVTSESTITYKDSVTGVTKLSLTGWKAEWAIFTTVAAVVLFLKWIF